MTDPEESKRQRTAASSPGGPLTVSVGLYHADVLVDDVLREPLQNMCRDVMGVSSESERPASRVEILKNGAGGYVLRSDGRLWADDVDVVRVPDELVRMLDHAALDADHVDVHIHAGAVVRGDQTAVIAGWPGSGKSSGIVSLLEAGFAYVSDERLTVASDGHTVSGFPKPISLVIGSFEAYAHVSPTVTGHGVDVHDTWQLPASSIGPLAPGRPHTPTVVIFIRYRASTAVAVTRLGPVRAAARLLADSPDVGVRGAVGADAIVSLVATTPCVELCHGSGEVMVDTVRGLLDAPPPVSSTAPKRLTGTARPVPPPSSPNELDMSQCFDLAQGVSVWVMDEEALAFVEPTGNVVELDSANTAWLLLAAGADAVDCVVAEMSEAGPDADAIGSTARHVLHGLWTSGVLAPSAPA